LAAPAPVSGGPVVRIVVTGLPAPLIAEIPSSIEIAHPTPLTAVATLADGTTSPVKVDAIAWSTSDPAIASISGAVLVGYASGTIDVTAQLSNGMTVSTVVVVRGPFEIIREEFAGWIDCLNNLQPLGCPYSWCPKWGPYWVFPVYNSGTFELLEVENHGWSSPMQWLEQRSPTGKLLKSWNIRVHQPVAIPGGFMYGFGLDGSETITCGPARAIYTHPS
jgi:hypothetical protein